MPYSRCQNGLSSPGSDQQCRVSVRIKRKESSAAVPTRTPLDEQCAIERAAFTIP